MNYKQFLAKHKLKEGQLVELSKGKASYKGYLVPLALQGKKAYLKLENGYNVGIGISPKLEVKKLKGTKKVGKPKPAKCKVNPRLPTIAILHTGGTIASRVDYASGAVYSGFTPEDLTAMFPELSQISNLKCRLLGQMWSENLRFKHYAVMAKEITKQVKAGVKGVILSHGTDTMHYTSAALAFMLENCPIPVILVGAQRSSDRGSSDAGMNLICAAEFITKTDFKGIGICMHETTQDNHSVILPACKTRKMHSSRRDAFKPVNAEPIARIDYNTRKIEKLQGFEQFKASKGKLVLRPGMEEKVAILKTHTNMSPEQFSLYKKLKYKGLVLEATGLGHAPIQSTDDISKPNLKIKKALKELIGSGCVVVVTTQTIFGRVQMHVYSAGVELTELGAIPGEDMLPETAFIKLAWLLKNSPKKEVPGLVRENLRGEITVRTVIEEEFL